MLATTAKNVSEGRSIVTTIFILIFVGILCSVASRLSSSPTGHDISKAEVNVGFGDSGDSITAAAIIKVEVPKDTAEDTGETEDSGSDRSISSLDLESSKLSSATPTTTCYREQEDDVWEMVMEFCKFREDVWNLVVKILLQIRDIICKFRGDVWDFGVRVLLQIRDILCDILDTLLELTNGLIQIVDCNLNNDPWSGCSSSLLKDVLVWLELQDKIFLQWIPPTIPTTGLNMIQKLLISFATVLCFFITTVLCIFFENSPDKEKIIKKLFGEEPSEAEEYSNDASLPDSSSSSSDSSSIRLPQKGGLGTVSKIRKIKDKKTKASNNISKTRKAIKNTEKVTDMQKEDDSVKVEVAIDKTS